MKKINWLLVFLNTLCTGATAVFFLFTIFQLTIAKETPFNFKESYNQLRITNIYTINQSETVELKEKIHTLVSDQDVVIIMTNIDLVGLALYDPQGYFKQYPLKTGNYLDFYDPLGENEEIHQILVKENSFLYNSMENNTIMLHGKEYKVVGVYSEDHPLATENTQYIYNFFSTIDLRGEYVIYTENEKLIDEIIILFDNSEYKIKIFELKKENLFITFLNQVITIPLYLTSFIGIIFIYFNYYLYFNVFLSKFSKISSIHLRFGATKFKLLLEYSKEILMSLTIGSGLGSIFYWLFIPLRNEQPPFKIYLLLLVVSISLSYLLFAVVYWFKKFNDTKWRVDYER
ncbi:hypothetical protein [Anaerobranca gottschalkii]|uniref:FtsX-like permease family protein n=1 Tax=Anaerobranca gottschalkii DSM 13577 TaxID=1120990 RepID=A0A1H9YLZ2_9FIRM|nr:hypothetical protein [Anaerobranca gottschalkii]SES70140.1 hypothetical protein SAMN03080614_10043 [Anaerobranca gottschalkii DSM 13577]